MTYPEAYQSETRVCFERTISAIDLCYATARLRESLGGYAGPNEDLEEEREQLLVDLEIQLTSWRPEGLPN
jgi:hypothetical protein